MKNFEKYRYITRDHVKMAWSFWPKDIKKPDLKPCPFCGEPGVSWFDFVDIEDDPGGGNCFFAGCPECGIIFYSLWTPERAAERWNERSKDEV